MSNDLRLGIVLVVIPTYNEKDNLEPIVSRVLASVPDADILIVDDNSPDGTGRIADYLSATDNRIHVLHGRGKSGLGKAYLSGFSLALRWNYDVVVEMDADGSHDPAELPSLLAALDDADLVLGSRWVKGGTVINWPKSRQILSRAGNAYSRYMLGMPARDLTGGYRAFRASALRKIDLDSVNSQGYCFQVTWHCAGRAGLAIVEVPITFVERQRGSSKMSNAIVFEALWRVTRWSLSAKLHGTSRPTNADMFADRLGKSAGGLRLLSGGTPSVRPRGYAPPESEFPGRRRRSASGE